MTAEPHLFEARKDELTQLVDAHLERGSLDEGNATTFDAVIDAWLEEEVARLDGAISTSMHAEAMNRASGEAELEHRRLREVAADNRWDTITQAHQSARAAAIEARRSRHDERVRAAADRLDRARRELTEARQLLMGTSSPRAHTAGQGGPDPGRASLSNDDAEDA